MVYKRNIANDSFDTVKQVLTKMKTTARSNTVKLLIEPHVNVKILLKIEFKSDFFERALFG